MTATSPDTLQDTPTDALTATRDHSLGETHVSRADAAKTRSAEDSLAFLADRAARLNATGEHAPHSLIAALDAAFARHPTLALLVLEDAEWQAHPDWPTLIATLGGPRVLRSVFYQQPWHWLGHAPTTPAQTPFAPELGHPQRPAKPSGEVYRRLMPKLGQTFSLRVIERERDLERFVRWMHLPRVAEFWEQAWPEAELAEFIDQRLADPHTLPLIGEFDGRAFGYFELYWAAEDRLAPHYPWAPFDRGIHLLVGEEDVRGPQFVDAWLGGLSHYAYLCEPRTTRLVLEPRHDNQRLFRHLGRLGLERLRDFDFPHKRSSLVMGQRDHFFSEIL
ncbi:GNAT family N-acetyltransferase [Salinicola sp. JS01]|uniref:GNAT family N-acetyltransferase n=1 Tax=Salinicola sp. JS01 TaxID=3050071 RepID=UPI00255BF2B9|nr:GNAT family N-acetyltransferase [Salinicola sp. JS01]WIX33897.1 GNAT family N-acetyltransferase [Salinicola sp. JS01]